MKIHSKNFYTKMGSSSQPIEDLLEDLIMDDSDIPLLIAKSREKRTTILEQMESYLIQLLESIKMKELPVSIDEESDYNRIIENLCDIYRNVSFRVADYKIADSKFKKGIDKLGGLYELFFNNSDPHILIPIMYEITEKLLEMLENNDLEGLFQNLSL